MRYLARARVGTRRTACRGCSAIVALTYAALCMPAQARLTEARRAPLCDELDRQILPDGGHVSRNPGVLVDLLLDLLPLRQAYRGAQHAAAAGAASTRSTA